MQLHLQLQLQPQPHPLPHCPQYPFLLRPNIVWFTEALLCYITDQADAWIVKKPIDLVLVIGTTAQVWPAAGYVDAAMEQGAQVAMVNVGRGELVSGRRICSNGIVV
jgi:NAD-dependent SIR2 family protein deacetylase